MRLLIVGLNFAPELTGVGKYTGEMAAWFAARGHDVSVITTRPYYPNWQAVRGLSRFTWRTESWRGCRIIRCPLYVPRRLTTARRFMHLSSFAVSSIPAAITQIGGRFDVVAGIVPTLLSAPVALTTARLLNAKAWLHVQDLELDAANRLGIVSNTVLMRVGAKYESKLVKRFDLVTAVSSRMLAALQHKGANVARLALFPNWVDPRVIHPLHIGQSLRAEFGISHDACVVLYSGSMGEKQGLNEVIAAARILADFPANITFVLAGAGPARSRLQLAAADLKNVLFLPLVEEGQFNHLLNMADIHILPQRCDANDVVMPSKLGPMLAVGKPVVATAPSDSEIAGILRGAGKVITPDDPSALANALYFLAGNPLLRLTMGRMALHTACSKFAADRILEDIEQRLTNLAQQSPRHGPATRKRIA